MTGLKTVWENPWVRAAGVVLAILLLGSLGYLLKPVLIPLFLAFLVAYALDPVVDFFERRRMSRTVTIGCLALLAVGLLASLPLYVVPGVITQAEELVSAAQHQPDVHTGLAERLNVLLEKLPLDRFVREMGWVDKDAVDIDSRAILAREVGNAVKTNASQLLKTVFSAGGAAGTTMADFLSSVGRGAFGALYFLGNLVLFAFVAGYLLKDFDILVESTRNLVPPRYREKSFDVVKRIDLQIRGFLRGQALVCLCLGAMYCVGLSISGVPFALVIGAFGGVASFVPYLGLILTIGPALLLALLQYGVDGHVVGVLATFVIAQSIEGSLLTPKIVGTQVGLNPVWVILAIMVFGSTFGFLGLLLAVPMAAALKVLVLEGVAYYKRSPVFASADSPPAKRSRKRSSSPPSSEA